MTFEKKTYLYVVLCAAVLVFLQIFVFDLYRLEESHENHSNSKSKILIVNKLSFGLNTPFFQKNIMRWQTPKTNDYILFFSKSNHISFAKITHIPNNIIETKDFREIVPNGYVYGITILMKARESPISGFIPIKNISGKVLYMIDYES